MTFARLLRLVCALALCAGVPAAAWAGPPAKVFPLASTKSLPAALEGAPERLTEVIAKLTGAAVSDSSIGGAAMAAGCSIDDSTCLDQIARAGRVKELVFGTIRVGDDERVFVKLTRYIAGTERREKTFVLASGPPAALARQLARSAREMFELPPLDDEGGRASPSPTPAPAPAGAPARPRRRVARTEVLDDADDDELGGGGAGGSDTPAPPAADEPAPARRGRVTAGTYLLLSGGVMAMAAGTGFAIAGSALSDDLANAKKTTPDDLPRLTAIQRAARIRTTTGTILLVGGGLATAGGVVRALLQRRPIDADRTAVSIVPVDGGAAVVLSGLLPD